MLEMLLTSSALIAVILLVRRLFRSRLSLRLRYALWLLAAVRLLVPGSLFTAPVSIAGGAAPVAERLEEYRYEPQRSTVYVSVSAGEARAAAEGTLSREDLTDLAGGRGLVVAAAPATAREAGGEEGQAYVRLEVETPRDHFAWLRLAWLAGMAVMAAWFFLTNLRFRLKLRRCALPVEGAQGRLPLYVMPGLPSPCLCGLVRPAVYVTPDCLGDRDKLRHITAHEYAHYRQGDQLWAVVRCVCLAVWWFNPLVWLAAVLSRRDCELACDEAAIRALGEEERMAYGRTLIGVVATAGSPAALMQTATTMTGGKRSIRERITLIAKKPRMTAATLACALLIAALAVGCSFSGRAAKALPETWYGDYLAAGEVYCTPVLSYAPTRKSLGTLTIATGRMSSSREDGDFGAAAENPGYAAVEFDRAAYGSDSSAGWMDDLFGRYETISAYAVAGAARPTHLLVMDDELWLALGAGEPVCYVLRLTPAAEAERYLSAGVTDLAAMAEDGDLEALRALVERAESAPADYADGIGGMDDDSRAGFLKGAAALLAEKRWSHYLYALMAPLPEYDIRTMARAYSDAVPELRALTEWLMTPGINGFAASLYENPEDADLFEAFYEGHGEINDDSSLDVPEYRLTADEINAVLEQRLGFTRDKQWLIENFPWVYDGETDAFYFAHGDTNFLSIVCYEIDETSGGCIYAQCYTECLGFTKLLLESLSDGSYRFLANTRRQAAAAGADVPALYQSLTGSLDFYLSVDGLGEPVQVWAGGGRVLNIPFLDDIHFSEYFSAGTPEGASLTIESADGDTYLRFWAGSSLVLVHQNGTDTYLAAAAAPGVLYQRLMNMADEALRSAAFDTTVPESEVGLSGGATAEEGVLAWYAAKVAENIRTAPDWVSWKPLDIQPGEVSVTQSYFGSQPNFCGAISLYLRFDSPDLISGSALMWQAGAGLEEITEGEYAGYARWGTGIHFSFDWGSREYISNGMYTGGETLILPTPMEDAPLSELLEDILFTSAGLCHDYQLPYTILRRFTPEEINTALLALYDERGDWQARQVAECLGRFLAEYGDYDDVPGRDAVYNALDGKLRASFAKGEGEA